MNFLHLLIVFTYVVRNTRLHSLYTSAVCLIINLDIYFEFVHFRSHPSPRVSRGLKRQTRENDRSPPCSTEVQNGGAIPPLPSTSSWRGA
jgi:hypothetical protein